MRAFVVLNGPSLRDINLDCLMGETTFACNRIDMLYDAQPEYGIRGTDWRPTYYLFIEAIFSWNKRREPDDNGHWMTYVPRHVLGGEYCFIRNKQSWRDEFKKKMGTDEWPNVQWLDAPNCHPYDVRSSKRPKRWHLPTVCRYGGTAGPLLQLAFMMGFDPVIVIGADLGYDEPDENSDPNHFHPHYWTFEDHPLEFRDDTLRDVHRIAKYEFERMGKHIYNATLGGELDVYERVRLEDIL